MVSISTWGLRFLISLLFAVLLVLHLAVGGLSIIYFLRDKRRTTSLQSGLIFGVYGILFLVFMIFPQETLQEWQGFILSVYVLLIPAFIFLAATLLRKVLSSED